MPHPKNHMKLTGDTHLPDIGFEPIEAEEMEMVVLVEEPQPRVYADGWTPSAQETPASEAAAEPPSKTQALVQKMERVPSKSPWLVMGAALLFGWLAARTFRALQRS